MAKSEGIGVCAIIVLGTDAGEVDARADDDVMSSPR